MHVAYTSNFAYPLFFILFRGDMKLKILLIFLLGVGISVGLYYFMGKKVTHPISLETHLLEFKDPYLSQVQPILNQKCVACHSCANSPCQLDLTSFEGISRGANKKKCL